MGTLYFDTNGSATNSGSTDQNAANLTGTAAVAAGVTVTLDGSPSLSGLITSGPNQSSVFLSTATNTNKKIFWIVAFNDTLKTIDVEVAPTGVSASAWAIGGRQSAMQQCANATRAGDVTRLNTDTPASASTAFVARISGDSTSGFAQFIGKTGVRPKLTVTGTNNGVTSANHYLWFENLEVIQQGATGIGISITGDGTVLKNMKFSDSGGIGAALGSGCRILGCEFSGMGGDALTFGTGCTLIGNYIHDITGNGSTLSGANSAGTFFGNVIDTCAGRGILYSGASSLRTAGLNIINNTIYGCGDSGLEVSDADSEVILFNNVFVNNGDAAGEYNVEWAAGSAEMCSVHGYNIFYQNGAGGNLLNLTINAQYSGTEFTTDPLLIDPANGDFRLGVGSPGISSGYPGALDGGGTGLTGYLDMGALQILASGAVPTFFNGAKVRSS